MVKGGLNEKSPGEPGLFFDVFFGTPVARNKQRPPIPWLTNYKQPHPTRERSTASIETRDQSETLSRKLL